MMMIDVREIEQYGTLVEAGCYTKGGLLPLLKVFGSGSLSPSIKKENSFLLMRFLMVRVKKRVRGAKKKKIAQRVHLHLTLLAGDKDPKANRFSV